jgi:hypothetical protein
MLWIELAEPPRDPGDRYFARVLAYGTDPMLQHPEDADPPIQPEPALPLDPEPVWRITLASADDRAGLDAMQHLMPSVQATPEEEGEAAATRFWGLPLPPGVSEDSPELLGMWTYEIRVGHYHDVKPSADPDARRPRWCTAQSRFGPPLRLAGVQHPAPPLPCAAWRPNPTTGSGVMVEATAPLASIADKYQPTSLWFVLYAQAALMDGSGQRRNVLLLRRPATMYQNIEGRSRLAGRFGICQFKASDVQEALRNMGFVSSPPLSVIAVEMLQPPVEAFAVDPLGYGLGSVRILRTSPLVEVKARC